MPWPWSDGWWRSGARNREPGPAPTGSIGAIGCRDWPLARHRPLRPGPARQSRRRSVPSCSWCSWGVRWRGWSSPTRAPGPIPPARRACSSKQPRRSPCRLTARRWSGRSDGRRRSSAADWLRSRTRAGAGPTGTASVVGSSRGCWPRHAARARLDALVSRLALGMTAGEELLLEDLLAGRAPLAMRDVLAWHERLPPVATDAEAPHVELIAAVVLGEDHS